MFLALGFLLLNFTANGGVATGFVWPAISFLLVACAYLEGHVRIFGKRVDGTHEWWAILLLQPYFVFAEVVWQVQVSLSREPAWSRVNERLIVSRRLRETELPPKVTHVLDLTCELRDPNSIRRMPGYRCFPILDAGTPRLLDLKVLMRQLRGSKPGCLLIHCANGHGRSGLVAAVWLVFSGNVTNSHEALDVLTKVRPRISLNTSQLKLLREFELSLRT